MIHQLAYLLLVSALQAETPPPGEAAAPAADDPAFTRYQLILDRKPFGLVASPADAAAAAEAAENANQPPLSASLRLVALEMDDETGSLQAGLIEGDKKSHYLTIGEEEDGIKLVSADFAGDRALIRKGTQEEWLTMGAGGSRSSADTKPTDPTNEIGRRERFREMMAARLAQRRTNLATNMPPLIPSPTNQVRQWKDNEEMKEHYRKQNMDLIRAGGRKGPPLPIALTPEEDAQLVKEGVLPPVAPSVH